MIRIAVDSASDISEAQAKELGIDMLPMIITFGDEEYMDGVNLLPTSFYEKLIESDELPKTSQISPYRFEEFFETMINDVANTGKVYRSMSDNEAELATALHNQRLQVMGVSSDEELSNMIRYQQAYNAASRYINVISEMIETLIMRTGV